MGSFYAYYTKNAYKELQSASCNMYLVVIVGRLDVFTLTGTSLAHPAVSGRGQLHLTIQLLVRIVKISLFVGVKWVEESEIHFPG
jgi:hypothetical protein